MKEDYAKHITVYNRVLRPYSCLCYRVSIELPMLFLNYKTGLKQRELTDKNANV